MKILHVAPDEKFIDMAIRVFEQSGFAGDLVIVGKTGKSHVKSNCLARFAPSVSSFNKIKFLMGGYDLIVIHSIFDYRLKFPKKDNRKIKILWIGFGYDYYDLIKSNSLYGSETIKIVKKSLVEKLKMKTIVNTIKRYRKFYFLRRVTHFAPVLLNEYELIEWPEWSRPELVDWNYGTLEDDWSIDGVKSVGENIIVGNSATAECNHLESLERLNKIKVKGKIFLPVSYGNSNYLESLKKVINTKKICNLVYLEEFINYDDYIRLLSGCSVFVMGHYRQQALGNIYIAIGLGAKVFLDVRNPIYEFLRSYGVHIFSLEQLTENECYSPLSKSMKLENYRFLQSYISRDTMCNKTKRMLGQIKGFK